MFFWQMLTQGNRLTNTWSFHSQPFISSRDTKKMENFENSENTFKGFSELINPADCTEEQIEGIVIALDYTKLM